MRPRSVMAQCPVADLRRAQTWYEQLLERAPDSHPMDGLIEWHFGRTAGLQVWHDPDRAGKSTVVLDVPEFGEELRRLDRLGMAHEDRIHRPTFQLVLLYDPDGNRIVLKGD